MKALVRENGAEALVGLLVLALGIWFVWFVWTSTGGGGAKAGATRVTALFQNAGGVNVGTDVRVAGLKVGSVAGMRLDPKTYQVETTLAIDPGVKVPSDSSAAITSEGLLGSNYIGLLPGGAETPLKSGDVIQDTQGAVDLMSMVGQFITQDRNSGDKAGGADAAPKP